MTARPTRGRPATFDDALRHKYLEAVAAGMYLKDAAPHCGIHPSTPKLARRTDKAFAAALDHARAEGRKARLENLDHDEARYNNYGCRCTTCRTAHTNARRGRRQTADTDPPAEVIDLHPTPANTAAESVLLPLLLVKAS